MRPDGESQLTEVDHKSVIAALSPQQRQSLLGKSDVAGLRHLAGHLAAIGLSTWLVVTSGAWRPLFMLVQGVLLVFLFTLLHETLHRTPFRTRRLNDWVGRACGLVIFLEADWFRYFHLAHHRYTNDPHRDPELASPRPATTGQYLAYLSGVPEFAGRLRQLVSTALAANTDDYVPSAAKEVVKRNARLQVLVYLLMVAVSVAIGSGLLLFVWLLPLIMAGPFLRAYLLAEHGGCDDDPSMFVNTRTVLTNPLVRFVTWNMPYHAEHHAFPAVPFHKLGAFHEHTRPHLAVIDRGYVRFNTRYLKNTRTGK